MFQNFTINEGVLEECNIIIEINDIIEQHLTMPIIFAKMQFANLVQQAINDIRPIQIICENNTYTETGKLLVNKLIYRNNSYVELKEKQDK